MESFGRKLQQARKQKRMTQQQVANQLGINRSTYTYYELGKSNPDLERLYRLSRLLEVSADWLLSPEDTEATK